MVFGIPKHKSDGKNPVLGMILESELLVLRGDTIYKMVPVTSRVVTYHSTYGGGPISGALIFNAIRKNGGKISAVAW